MNKLYVTIFTLCLGAVLVGCDNPGPAERTGEKIDEAVEETKEELEKAKENIKEQTQ